MKELFLKTGTNWGMKALLEVCEKNNLNPFKVLCLRWQSTTGNKCPNRNHQKDIYKNKMECEQTLTEIITLHLEVPDRKSYKLLLTSLLKKVL